MDNVLDKAIGVFRKQGYHGTSINDLAAATGLAGGSIYKAFRVKDAIFRAAFGRYNHVRNGQLRQLIDTDKSGREKLRDVIMLYVEGSQGDSGRQGCLVVGGAVELSTLDVDTAKFVEDALWRMEKLVSDLIRAGQADGSISNALDAKAAARFILCLLQGFRVVGKTAPTRREMAAAADVAMKVLD